MILDTIAEHTRKRVEAAKKQLPPEKVKNAALKMGSNGLFPFEKTVAEPGLQFICEVKRASPSKGLIAAEFSYIEIAKEYEMAGAAAISVLTEPDFFLGKNEYLSEIANTVSLPVLRKDFVIDEYQIYEAKLLGASAVLLICALLNEDMIREYITICDWLGLSALVEVHDEEELRAAISAGARVIGVNNRNLKNFTVDIGNSLKLRALAPPETLFVAESGIHSATDTAPLRACGVNAVLIGEAMMKAPDKSAFLKSLRGE